MSVNLQHFSYKIRYLMSIALSGCLMESEDPVVGKVYVLVSSNSSSAYIKRLY